jgi:putative ABC transport system permease protein
VYTGIQKVMGADRRNIFTAAVTEVLLLMLVCSGLAFLIGTVALPGFNAIMGLNLSLANFDWVIALIFIAVCLFIVLITSAYQSFNLSGVSPVTILTGNLRNSIIRGKASFSRFSQTLTVVQLSIAMLLVVGVITVYKQTSLMMEKKLGFNKEQMIVLQNPWDESIHRRYELLKKELSRIPEVKGIGASWNSPGENINNYGHVGLTEMGEAGRILFGQLPVDEGFLDVVEARFLQGRNFDKSLRSDSNKVIVNKTGMDLLNLTDPLGQKVRNLFNNENSDYEIIGVVNDIQYQSLRENSEPAIYYLSGSGLYRVMIRLNPGNIPMTLKKIEQVWKDIAPEYAFDYRFADQMIQSNYAQVTRTRSLLSVMAFLAIAISMLGIFGLGVFMAQRRIKEIGIRKVNGAKISEMVLLLNKDFVKWVTLAFIIATPVAWLVMHKWLEGFAYKTILSWWIFVLAGLLAMIVALLTVTWQSWRAATRNPVESLRYE